MKKRNILCYGLFFLFAACQSGKGDSSAVPMVKIDTARIHGNHPSVEFPGKVRAVSEINLSFRTSGTIMKINLREGSFARKGEVLAEMDSRDYALQYAATEAEYNQVKGEVERVIRLYGEGSVTENDYEKALAGLEQITAKYNAHKNALNDTRLTAPFDGFVQQCYFNSNETVAAGMPVCSFISAGEPEVVVSLPANEFIRRDRFESYEARFEIFPGVVFPLEFVAVNQKANLNQLYTMRLKIRAIPGQPLPSPGMSAMVEIRLKPEASTLLSITNTALFERDGKSMVWVYDGKTQTVRQREVEIREILPDGAAVVSAGLREGEAVVTAGVRLLREGAKVDLQPSSSPSNIGGLL